MAKARPTVEPGSWSPKQFADRHDISESKLYGMWRSGGGPGFLWIGGQRRITPEHEREWLAKLQAQTVAA